MTISSREPSLIPRRVESAVRSSLADTRVTVIAGARQVGKSTLARLVAATQADSVERRLDEPAVLDAARADPVGFARHEGLMVIDEIQRAPELMLAIKSIVDLDPRPGRFLLTGSANLQAMSNVADALPGRIETIELGPLTQGELRRAPDGLLQALFTEGPDTLRGTAATLGRSEYVAAALIGGMPGFLDLEPERRTRLLRQYLSGIVDREIRALSAIRRPVDLRRLIALLGAIHAQPIVIERLARDAGLKATTVAEHVHLLELLFLIQRIPAWSNNLTRQATAKPKLVFTDSGVAGALIGQGPAQLLAPGGRAGALIEGFVLGELQRQIANSPLPLRLWHYRTQSGVEVDAVIEDERDGRILGIEIKSGETAAASDARHLRHLAEKVGDRFVGGVILTAQRQALSLGGGIWTAPIAALWQTPGAS